MDPARRLEMIADVIAGCTKCRLHECRNRTVPGAGNHDTRLMLVGEGPGENEDREGVPFIGKAGELLNNILAAAGIRREDVFVANAVKCRPPANRTPRPDEIAACRPYLKLQIKTVGPQVILCLGAVAAEAVLERAVPSISALRGEMIELGGISVVCTYHPSYLLRNQSAKPLVWDDVQIVLGLLSQAAATSSSTSSTGTSTSTGSGA